MPIRMEKDDPNSGRRPTNNNPRTNQSGGGLLKLLPFLLMFLVKKPKLIIPILIIGAVLYFLFGDSNLFLADNSEEQSGEFFFGATLDEAKYDEAMVFEPLAYSASQNYLPTSVSLEKYAPNRLHQGQQGSCVGWASSYAARSILQSRATGQNPNQASFSPSFLYNQIALRGCQGAYMLDAMETMKRGGVLPLAQYPYSEASCSNLPNAAQQRAAQQFRIKGYNRLTLGGSNYKPDLMGIKQHLAQGAPVVIGMQVGGTFMHEMRGQKTWVPTRRDYSMSGYSGHAMCVIGYDDSFNGGSFQIMNSWGPSWGEQGIAWVRYPDFELFVKEAYGLYPMGDAPKYDPNKLGVKFGLVENTSQQLIPLSLQSNRVFRTRSPIQKGDKFKIAVTNTVECYIYVFGEETDGSSYVLFPYTEKHSPYCGITGTRLFPKDYSMTADQLGNLDRMAVVVSKSELDYEALNQLINRSSATSYDRKLREAIRDVEIPDVQFEAGEAIEFLSNVQGKEAVGVVIEIEKK